VQISVCGDYTTDYSLRQSPRREKAKGNAKSLPTHNADRLRSYIRFCCAVNVSDYLIGLTFFGIFGLRLVLFAHVRERGVIISLDSPFQFKNRHISIGASVHADAFPVRSALAVQWLPESLSFPLESETSQTTTVECGAFPKR